MRINSKLQKALILVTIIATSISCKEEVPPTVITSDVTDISETSAKSGGSLISEGTSAVMERGVCWSTNPEPTTNDGISVGGNEKDNYTSNIINLNVATTYYLRAYATNSSGVGYGITRSFRTLGSAPSVIAQSVTGLTATTATLNAEVNSNHIPTTVTFEYGITTSYGNSVISSNSPFTSPTNIRLSVVITDLLPNQTYHCRVKSENTVGISYGNDMTFKTMGAAPVVVSASAASMTVSSAVLYGTVNPNYLPTEITFECGTTTSYELPALVLQSPVTGSTGTIVSIKMTGLTTNTTYHFRIKAVNSLGTTYGDDVSFMTNTSDFPTDGLVSYYNFQGNPNDCIGDNNGSGYNIDYIKDGNDDENLVLKLNGINSYVQLNNNFDLENRTINLWFNVVEAKSELSVIYASDNPGINYGLTILGAQLINSQPSIIYNISNRLDTIVIEYNTWYNATLISEGKKYAFYFNNIKLKSGAFDSYVSSSTGVQSAIIGCNRLLSARFFKGMIEDLRIYNRKLSDYEIELLYITNPLF